MLNKTAANKKFIVTPAIKIKNLCQIFLLANEYLFCLSSPSSPKILTKPPKGIALIE